MRIACWSGPRNISTAMMRAFGSRKDCAVTDEPLYAAYLHTTGKNHPVRDAVIASQSTDPSQVTREITGPIPGGRVHWYQKFMAHHLLPGWDGPLPSRQFSGMIDAKSWGGQVHQQHYWLVESERDPKNDPLVVWYDPSKFGDKMRRIRGDLPAPGPRQGAVAPAPRRGHLLRHRRHPPGRWQGDQGRTPGRQDRAI